jgi:putative addiction module killer protein
MDIIEVRQTDEFRHWLHRLGDGRAKARITSRIRRMETGNPGDNRSLGGALQEMIMVPVTASTFLIAANHS